MKSFFINHKKIALIFFIILFIDIYVKHHISVLHIRFISKPFVLMLLFVYYYFNREENKKKSVWVFLALVCFFFRRFNNNISCKHRISKY